MDFTGWVRRWLTQHPLKEPAETDRAQYTAEVMARVRRLAQPAPAPRRVWWLPACRDAVWSWWCDAGRPACRAAAQAWRPVLVTVTAAAAVVLVVGRVNQAPIRVAHDAEDGPMVAAVDKQPLIAQPAVPEDALVEEFAQSVEEFLLAEALILAESSSEDEAWLEETLRLLDALDEDLPDGGTEDWSDDDWLDELDLFEDEDFFASS